MSNAEGPSDLMLNEFAEESARQVANFWRLWGWQELRPTEVEELATAIWEGLQSLRSPSAFEKQRQIERRRIRQTTRRPPLTTTTLQ